MHVYSTPLMSHLTHDDKQSEKCACFYVWMESHVRLSKRDWRSIPAVTRSVHLGEFSESKRGWNLPLS